MSNPNHPPPSYDYSRQDPKYGDIPPAGMMNPDTSYLERFNNTVTPSAEGGGGVAAVGFADNTIRRTFIRKVYAILTFQLAVTGGVIAGFQASPALRGYVGPEGNRDGFWLLPTTWVLYLFTYCFLVCPCCSFKRKYPINVILLSLMTISLSIATAIIAVYYETRIVVMAAGTTSLVVLVVTCLTFWSKFDITKFWYIVMIAPLGMLLVWPFMWFFPGISAIKTVYCGLGVMVFTLYLAYDTKTIIGGGRHQLEPDDYILGVVELYVDIVHIFLYLLNIFGRSD